MKQYKNLTPAQVAALVEAGEAAHDLACIDKRGGVAALQNDPRAAVEVQDVLDSINGKRFALVLNALTDMEVSKVAKAGRGDTGSRSVGGMTVKYDMQHVGTGNILSVTYSTRNGFSIRDTLAVSAAEFAATLGHMMDAADAVQAAEVAAQKAQFWTQFAERMGITHSA